MTGQAYNRAKTIFLAACDVEPEEREAILDRECGDDTALRRDVDSLLSHFDATMNLSDTSGAFMPAATPDAVETAPPPERIGPYRILHELGRGGMGVVYLALREDAHFKQRVAIKIVRKGMDTEGVLRRFDLERQVLAALNHPNIARLYDAGETGDGRPFFAMEYIEGIEIDKYCDAHRLHVGERLGLFRGVCSAVHYAHQNLIVHRDIKPGNILVTKDGVPKLMDFGIAKLVNPELSLMTGGATAPELRVMTPEFASPEQVRGEPITTASDIYSLGVLLYQLLSGHRPYRIKSRVRAEIERIVCDEQPDKPSTAVSWVEEIEPDRTHPDANRSVTPESVSRTRETRPQRLRKVLAGDLDNIVLMAMRKEPDRRYKSAADFAEDIHRHLDGMPVIARADTLAYRAAKFVRRHRGGVAAAAAFVVLLAASTIVSLAMWRTAVAERAAKEEQRVLAETRRVVSEQRFEQVRSIARSLMYDVHDAIDELEGALPARELVVATSLEYLETLRQDAEDDPGLAAELADGFDRLGDIEGGVRGPNLGRREDALERYRTAREIRGRLVAAAPDDPTLRTAVAVNHIRLGDIYRKLGRTEAARAEYEAARDIGRQLSVDDIAYRRLYGAMIINLGKIVAPSDNQAALDLYLEALEIRRTLVAERPEDPQAWRDVRRDLSSNHLYIAAKLARNGDLDAALPHSEESLRLRRALFAEEDRDRARRDLAWAEHFHAETLLDAGDAEAALAHVDAAFPLFLRRVEANPESVRPRQDLAIARELKGVVLGELGRPDDALEQFLEFRFLTSELVAAGPDEVLYRSLHANAHRRLGETAAALDRTDEALAYYRQTLQLLETLVTEVPDDARRREEHAQVLGAMGTLLADTGQWQAARTHLQAAVHAYDELVEAEPERLPLAAARDALATRLERLPSGHGMGISVPSLLAPPDPAAAASPGRM